MTRRPICLEQTGAILRFALIWPPFAALLGLLGEQARIERIARSSVEIVGIVRKLHAHQELETAGTPK